MCCLKRAAVVATVLIAGVLAGCGASSSSSSSSSSSVVSPAAYIKSVCTAVAPWQNDVVKRSAALNLPASATVPRVKQAIQSFLAGVSADSESVLSQLTSAGQANVTNGKAISAALVNAFSRLHAAITQALAQANALPTGSVQAFKAAAQPIGATIRSAQSSINASMQSSTLRSRKLEQAAAKVAACNGIIR